ncbi:hypothetical protein JRI60_03845 [Archangium violaceum]|uniref:hypothetical protein n=1 Tax=Archangium violaceum TaxID=83451 RepID=UPI00194F9697|nr:hypothetical protein [Archangium violaceum]QRN98212.1 hypothetical protein JRI60_03845 [Archangium violaceum]
MSHSTTNGALRVLEQGNLLDGAYLVPSLSGTGGKKRARKKKAAPKLGFVAALALAVQQGRQLAKEVGKTALSRCPRCGHVGPTQRDFGTRIIRGERRPQSWCRSCRKTNLPPLKAVPESSGRDVKAPHGETAPEKPEKSRRAAVREDGWLFPPEMLGGGGKRRNS